MPFHELGSDAHLKAEVIEGRYVKLQLQVTVNFALIQGVSLEREIENATRLLSSKLRERVATELEETWRGAEPDPTPVPGWPESGDPALDIDTPSEPTPPLATTSQIDVGPPPFAPNRRNSHQARTRQQQIVLHLEGRYGFKPDQRADRLAFTAWLTEVPSLTLTSTNDLTHDLAAKVLSRLNREPDAAHLIAEWRTYGLGLPVNLSAPEESLGL